MLVALYFQFCAQLSTANAARIKRNEATAAPVSDPPTPLSQPFYVDPTTLPKMPAGLGDSYSGLLPISANPGETNKLFFWYWKSADTTSNDLVVRWP